MSGVSAIAYILKNNTALTAVVSANKIMGGLLPVNVDLPAISITMIDDQSRETVKVDEGSVMLTERVQVTVEATTYQQQKQIIKLVRNALPLSRGIINSVNVDSIRYDGSGPDIEDVEMPAFIQSSDFIVKYTE